MFSNCVVFAHFLSLNRDRRNYIFISISKHLKGRSVPRVSDVFADSKDFVVSLFPDTFRNQEILSFPCFWTLSVFKGFCRFPVSRLFPYSKDFVIFLFPDSFRIQRILSFSCFQTLPYLKDFVIFLFPESFCIERILSFSCFQTLSLFKGFCRFPVSGLKPLNLNI